MAEAQSGLSLQVLPASLSGLTSDDDAAKARKAIAAIMQMARLDTTTLRRTAK
ncbi:MAG: hypothetical protein ABI538_02360 [Pseudoxanthomonas sp.]